MKTKSTTLVVKIDDGDFALTYPVGRCAAVARMRKMAESKYPQMAVVILSINGDTNDYLCAGSTYR